ncbi:MAG: SPFH/Band 7/PHB domain protein [Candidatus Freyarchaeota archaeon]|nr:SPFH/Band 7/PHB domain protein [Candidatus Jordarchaeia archaeon]
MPLQVDVTSIIAALIVIVLFVLIILISGLRVLREYERGVIFRLGKVLPKEKGPGIIFIIPFIDRMVKVDLREDYFDVPHQRCITKDNAPVDIDAIIYHKVISPIDSVIKVANWRLAAVGIAQTTLRSVVGDINLDQVLAEREKINTVLQEKLDEVTARWGVKVTGVEIREILPPTSVLDAMIRQMEAERIRRAIVTEANGKRESAILIAEGEKQAMITKAEAKRRALSIRAEGSKQAMILRAEGYAQALERIVSVAKTVDEKTMALQYIETLNKIGDKNARKYVIPSEALEALKQIGRGIPRATNPGKQEDSAK